MTLPCWGMVGSSSLVSRLPQLQTSLEMSAHSSAFVSLGPVLSKEEPWSGATPECYAPRDASMNL